LGSQGESLASLNSWEERKRRERRKLAQAIRETLGASRAYQQTGHGLCCNCGKDRDEGVDLADSVTDI